MANLKPCNFIVTKGGEERSLTYDEMRQYLLDNPELWTDISTRRKAGLKVEAPKEEKGQARIAGLAPATPEQLKGEAEVGALKKGEIITTKNPIRLLKGLYGKRNPDGTKRIIHKNVDGEFAAISEKIAEKYMGDVGLKIFEIPAGVTVETVKLLSEPETYKVAMSIVRDMESEAINNSNAQIVKLVTSDLTGREDQYIIKDPELRKLGYKFEEPSKGQQRSVRAFHGGPHKFEKFTTEKIGTGEGAQAFGWGLYFTDLKDIARDYAEKLSKLNIGDKSLIDTVLSSNISLVNNEKIKKVYDRFISLSRQANMPIKDFKSFKDFYESDFLYNWTNSVYGKSTLNREIGSIDGFYNYLEDIYNVAKENKKNLKSTKNLYEVSLHEGKSPGEYNWLEWDKQVDDGELKKINEFISKNIKLKARTQIFNGKREYLILGENESVLGKVVDANSESEAIAKFKSENPNLIKKGTGKEVYLRMVMAFGSDKNASIALLNMGIDGIKYPAESIAKGATSDTARGFNYVVFDENAVTINKSIQFRGAGLAGNPNNDTDLYQIGGEKLRESNYNVPEALKAVKDYLVSMGMTEAKAQARIDQSKLEQKLIRASLNYTASGQEVISGIAKSLVPQSIIDSVNIERRTTKEMFARGKELVDNGTINAEAMVKDIADAEKGRVLSPDEVAAAVYYKNNLDNKAYSLYDELAKARIKGDKAKQKSLEREVKLVELALIDYEKFVVKTAYEQSLAFRLRQLLADATYSLVQMKTKYAAKFGYVPEDVAKKFEEYEKKLRELRSAEEAWLKEKEDYEAQLAMDRVRETFSRERSMPKTTKIKVIASIQNIAASVKSVIPSFFSKKGKGQARATQQDTSDGEYVFKQAVEITLDAMQAINDVESDALKEIIGKGIKYLKTTTWYANLSKEEKVQAEKEFTKFIESNIVEPFAVGKNGLKIPHSLLKYYVEEEGLTDIDDVSAAILRDHKARLPEGADERAIRDAITQYGVRVLPSQEEVDKAIREMKRIGMKRSQIEDIKKGMRPLKSGPVRDEKTEAIRNLEKEVRMGLKELGIEDVDPEVYLKSALERIKTALANQIEDLNSEIKSIEEKIAAGEKVEGFKKSTKKIEYDAIALGLKEQRDGLKEIRDGLLEKAGVKTEIKIENAIKALEDSISEYERRLREGDFSSFRTEETLPETPELKAKRERRDALREEYNERKKNLVTPQMKEYAKLQELQDKLDDLLQKDAEGYYAESIEVRPKKLTESPAVKDLKSKIAEMEQRLGLAKLPEAKKLESLREQLGKIIRGETATRKGKQQGPDLPGIAKLKQQIQDAKDRMGITFREKEEAAVNAKLKAIQDLDREIEQIEKTGQRTPRAQKFNSATTQALGQVVKGKREALKKILEQTGIAEKERMEAAKKRDKRYIEELQRRIREKDFSKNRKPPIDFDAEGKRIQKEKRKVKDLYDYEFAVAELAQRDSWQKGVDLFWAGYNVPKSMLSGLDMSAPLRQGLPLLIGQLLIPGIKDRKLSFEGQKKALQNLKFMFKSTYDIFSGVGSSKDFYEDWLANLKESDEYTLMKAAGLYIAEESAKLKAGEELFANNLLHKAPIWQAPLVIGGRTILPGLGLASRSERAFNSFINFQRVQVFQHMAEVFKDAGLSERENLKDFKNLAAAINLFTGRAGLGVAEPASGVLNNIYFSIRLLVSKLQIFNLFWYASLYRESPKAAFFALQTTAKFVFAMTELLGLAYLYYASDDDDETKVDINPSSPTFGNIFVSKDTKVDITGGTAKVIGLATRLVGDEYIKSTTGETVTMKPEDKVMQSFNFIAGKLNPTLRLPANYFLSTRNKEKELITQFGEKYNFAEDVAELIPPLILQDAFKLYKKEGLTKTAALLTAGFFGVSVSTKPERYLTHKDISRQNVSGITPELTQKKDKAIVQLKEGKPEMFNEIIGKEAEEIAQTDIDNINASSMPQSEKDRRKEGIYENERFDLISDKFLDLTQDKVGPDYFPPVKKSGSNEKYNTAELVEAFFRVELGIPYPPINPMIPERQAKAIQGEQNEKIEIVSRNPAATRLKILELYGDQAKEREELVKTFDKLNVTKNGKPVDWENEFPYNEQGIDDWYTMYQEYESQKK